MDALSQRDLPAAERSLGRLGRWYPRASAVLYARVTLLARMGEREKAAELAARAADWLPRDASALDYWAWMQEDFGVQGPFSGTPTERRAIQDP